MWIPITYSFGEQAVQSEHSNHEASSKREHLVGLNVYEKKQFLFAYTDNTCFSAFLQRSRASRLHCWRKDALDTYGHVGQGNESSKIQYIELWPSNRLGDIMGTKDLQENDDNMTIEVHIL
jgi:hypothetical protein